MAARPRRFVLSPSRPLSLLLGGLLALSLAPEEGRAQVTFTDVTTEAGIVHTQGNPENACPFGGQWTGGGAVGDVDGDGLDDLFVSRMTDHDVLYRNNGDGTFTDITASSGLADFNLPTNGAAFGDVDNDGDLDLFLATMCTFRYYLFINDGTGSFTEEAVARGAAVETEVRHHGFGVAFGDYDRDGWLDIYVSEWRQGGGGPDEHARLLHNRGGEGLPGVFEDVSVAAGLDAIVDPLPRTNPGRYFFSPGFADLDGDHWPDLTIAGDFNTSRLFWNDRDGTFTDGTEAAGVGRENQGMGSTVGDYDSDGDLDWFVTATWADGDQAPLLIGNRLYRNEGDRTFSDQTYVAGVHDGSWGWGTVFFDYDNDGDLDIIMTNGSNTRPKDVMRAWRNEGDGTFTEVAEEIGITEDRSGRGLLTFDYDNDGDLDVVVMHFHPDPLILLRNDGGNASDWLRVEVLDANGREALGARVEVDPGTGEPLPVHEIGSAGHFLAQGERVAHFGLGPAAGPVDEVRVRWPSGRMASFTNVAPNTTLTATEPATDVCDDGFDNDGDGLADLDDPGCTAATDASEREPGLACDDDVDADGDGFAAFPQDPGCSGPADPSEQDAALVCDDGFDNDGDGLVDAADPNCESPEDPGEAHACDDGVDNDGDGLVDLDDPACTTASWDSELPACSDGLDNDSDVLFDYPDDRGCESPDDLSERSPLLICDDGADNEGDGFVDWPTDPGCRQLTSDKETTKCDDHVDNDFDGKIDWDGGPNGEDPDPQCQGQGWRDREAKLNKSCGIGWELALVVPALAALRRRRRR